MAFFGGLIRSLAAHGNYGMTQNKMVKSDMKDR
jgi:hypothetical protein